MRSHPLRKRIGLAIALTSLVALSLGGLYRVRSGEVAILSSRGSSSVGVAEEGWHWRVPGWATVRRYPRSPIGLDYEIAADTASVAGVVVSVAGRFGVAEGGEARWAAATGDAPFGDELARLLAATLESSMRATKLDEVFASSLAEELRERIAEQLDSEGVRVDGLTVAVPPEANGAAEARLLGELGPLASPTGDRVLVVGWDGADWLMIRPLLAAGRMPNLAALVARGVSGELRSEQPLLSPLVWTTIATGKPVLEHGIADFLVQDPATGSLVPISSASRRVHSLWTLLGAFGLRTDVVAWWATWPAEPVRGRLVSDRVAYQLFDVGDTSNEGKVHPQRIWPEIESRLVGTEEVGYDEVSRFVDISAEEFERSWRDAAPENRQQDKVNHLRKILATTESYHSIALSLLEDQADLTLVYYEGTDTVGHRFARYLAPPMEGIDAADVKRFGRALPEFYVYADEMLGELLAAASDETTVLLISDHGFFTGAARPASDPSDFANGAPQWHRLHGILVAAGPGIEPGSVDGATIFDVAPTVLGRLGLPVPADLPGRVLDGIVPTPSAIEAEPRLASYEVLPRRAPAALERSAELDRERLRELAALGYISTAAVDVGDGHAHDSDSPDPAPGGRGAELEGVATAAYNRGRISQRHGDHDGARREYRRAIEQMPGFGPAYASLAQLDAIAGDHCGAFETLQSGFAHSANLPMAAVTGLVDEASECGRLEASEAALRALPGSYRQMSGYHAALGLFSQKAGRMEDALAHYRRSLEIDPLDQLATEQTVALLRQDGREAEARSLLDTSFERADGQVTAMNQLAVVALRQGWVDQAERILKRVLESDPGNPGVLANLAACLMQQGRRREAADAMQRAVERDPSNARNHFNLGAILAELGRTAEAAAAFDAAVAAGLRAARVHVAASKMHFQLGDPARARRELQLALEIEPTNREAAELLALLRGDR